MISQLNSILLEGVVTNKKVATKKHRKVVVYTIKNTSREATNSKIQELSIDCYAYGELAEKSQPEISEGMTIRALGRLVMVDKKAAIHCQHLEFKRKKKKDASYEMED